MRQIRQATWQKGRVVGYPTESFYALGVRATDAVAIRRLFRLKHREPNKPVALIAADLAQVKKFFYVSSTELHLMKKYWPGALTMLLKPKKAIAARALGATRIGIRVPAHAGARRLAADAGAPLTATSANISGQPPTKSRRQLKHVFPDIMIVAGRCGRFTKPSTVVERRGHKWHVIRPGSITI